MVDQRNEVVSKVFIHEFVGIRMVILRAIKINN